MANKYQMRRRALKDSQSRDNPFASPRYGSSRTSPIEHTPPPQMDRPWITAGICCGFVLIITLLYVQTARHQFTVCDDNDYVYRNPMVTQGLTSAGINWAWGDSHAGNWHPLTWMSHMLDWQVFGTLQPENHRYVDSWPGGHHLVSMMIHCANAVLLFLALRLMTGTLWPCVVVTALFALHPLRAESVAWAAERKDVLCGLFWMASMLAYAFYVRRRPLLQSSAVEIAGTLGLYLLVTVFFFLALTAKSMAVTLPCVFMLLDAWPLGRWRRALWPTQQSPDEGMNFVGGFMLLAEKLPWIGLVVYDCLQTVVGQDKGVALNSWEGLPLWPRVVNLLVSIPSYLGQFFWPAGMAPFYPHPHMYDVPGSAKEGWMVHGWTAGMYGLAAVGVVILVGVTLAVVYFWRKPYLAVGWFWYLGAMMPVIGIMQVGTQARADRYTYLPMIGLYLMIVWLLKEAADRWPKGRLAMAASAVVVFTLLSVLAFQQVSYWFNSYTLFQHAVEVTDHNWFAYNHLGIQFDQDGIDTMKTDPSTGPPLPATAQYALAKLNIARTDPEAGQKLLDQSAANFAAAIDIKPDYDFGNNNLGVYYARKSDPEDLKKAEKYFRQALVSNQRYADAYNNLGIILARQGKLEEAVKCHKMGFTVRYDRDTDHNNLSRVYLQLGQIDDAMKENDLSLSFNANCIGAWQTRAEIFLKQDKPAEAARCYETIVRIDPKVPESIDARFKLGLYCGQTRDFEKAIACFTQILQLKGDIVQVLMLRSAAFEQMGDLPHAAADLERALQIAPQNPGAQQKLNELRAKLASPGK